MFAADFSSRQALADLERATGGDPLADDTSAAFDRAAPPDQVWAATASLLWQAMASRRNDPFLEDIWGQRQAELLAAPAPIRAALMNGFQRLCDLGLLEARCRPLPDQRVTHSRTDVDSALKTIARAMTLPEMDHISRADYGMDVARHRDALVALLHDPEVAYPKGDFWYPAEVVELVAHVPKSTGYIPCMAIVLLDALRTGDMQDNATFRLEGQWAELLALPQRARDAFLAAYRHLYETDILGSPNLPEAFTLPWVENIGPAPAKSDRRKR
ncbi:MAG: hypothetical protein ACKO2N_09600 [Tabrizicola sp.]